MKLNNNFITDSFTLNNKKLMNKIKITNNLKELKESCIQLSKKIFINENKVALIFGHLLAFHF